MKNTKKLLLIVAMMAIMLLAYQPNTLNAATTGTEKAPYALTLGTAKSVSSNNYWFSFKTRAYVDMKVTTSTNSKVVVYQKTVTGKKQIWSSGVAKSFTPSLSLMSSATYLINVINQQQYIVKPGTPTPLTSISCKVSLHQDKKTSAYGGVWTPDGKSPVPSTALVYLKRAYIPKSDCQKVYDAIENDKYLTVMNEAAKLTIVAGETLLADKLKITKLSAALFYNVACSGISIDFKKMMQNDMKAKGNYKSGKWGNGVQIDTYLASNGAKCTTIYSWKTSSMVGVAGYKGSWK